MKTVKLRSLFRMSVLVMVLTLFGFAQQAKAQLTVVNNTACWIIVGEQEGNNCTICNSPPGTWVSPFGGTITFNLTCSVSTPFAQPWVGVKFGDGNPFVIPPFVGSTSFTYNPFYPGGTCSPFDQLNSRCNGVPIVPTWTALGGGAIQVDFN